MAYMMNISHKMMETALNDLQWAALKAKISAVPGGAAYSAWMKKVDAIIVKKCGLGADDLPDFNYLDAFEDGFSPAAAAKEAIKWAKDF